MKNAKYLVIAYNKEVDIRVIVNEAESRQQAEDIIRREMKEDAINGDDNYEYEIFMK